jgi:hypothetical protein
MLSTAISAHLSITSRHNYSCAGHETSTPHHCLPLPICLPLNHSTMIYAYPLRLYLTATSDYHSHWSLHIRLPFLLSTFLFILPIPLQFHCLEPRPTFRYLSPFSTIFSYTASLSITPPYAYSVPFLSFSFPSHSYWLYHYIFILALTHPFIHPLSHWLAIVLLLFLHSSECSSCSHWLMDSIATPSCIYTYHK